MLVGASGLVGTHLLHALLQAPDVSRVHAVTRRALKVEHARLANRIVQFERLEEQLKGMTCHVAFCCLGTTLREAGSEQAQRRIDVGHVLAFARVARAAQAQRFVFLSCAGADPKSRKPDLRLKAEAEQALGALGFASLDILQPGTLLGMRRAMGPRELVRLGSA
ncbi:MAG: NAD(P)H-binding protein, partial [Acetobacteraceae bacterium]|nr:NAD(P)H-binding protein [Acetobacteraceae bacterium]